MSASPESIKESPTLFFLVFIRATLAHGHQHVVFCGQGTGVFLSARIKRTVTLRVLGLGISNGGPGWAEIEPVRRIHLVVYHTRKEWSQEIVFELLGHRGQLA